MKPSRSSPDSLEEQRIALGLPEGAFAEQIAEEAEREKPFPVFAENWESFLVFTDLRTSWRQTVPAMGGSIIYHGLIQSDIWSVIRDAHGHSGERAREIYRDIRTMEAAALAKLNEAK